MELTLHNTPAVIIDNDDTNNDDNDDDHSSPEVIEAREVSPLPGGAQDPEDVLRAVQVDQQTQAVVRLLRSEMSRVDKCQLGLPQA